jgi:hydroxymethylpyrimidine pyrophosphatase-like HAD family hydrolase
MHDKKELMPCYFLCDNGEKMWNEKKYIYQSSIDFDEAQKMLREQRTRYVEYLVANEKIKRCGMIKKKDYETIHKRVADRQADRAGV